MRLNRIQLLIRFRLFIIPEFIDFCLFGFDGLIWKSKKDRSKKYGEWKKYTYDHVFRKAKSKANFNLIVIVTFKVLKKRVTKEAVQEQYMLTERLHNKPFWIWNIEDHKQVVRPFLEYSSIKFT
jgi:hypothetical protein